MRWGQVVWWTEDPQATWVGESQVDGSYFAPDGAYGYVLRILTTLGGGQAPGVHGHRDAFAVRRNSTYFPLNRKMVRMAPRRWPTRGLVRWVRGATVPEPEPGRWSRSMPGKGRAFSSAANASASS